MAWIPDREYYSDASNSPLYQAMICITDFYYVNQAGLNTKQKVHYSDAWL